MEKKWWSRLPYWLKGGIIGLIVSLFQSISLHLYMIEQNKISDCMPAPCYNQGLFEAIFYNPAFYIIIVLGIFVGWIIGIIKSRKKRR